MKIYFFVRDCSLEGLILIIRFFKLKMNSQDLIKSRESNPGNSCQILSIRTGIFFEYKTLFLLIYKLIYQRDF